MGPIRAEWSTTMTMRLEDELVAGMRAHTAGLRPRPDPVNRAARGVRRRRLAVRGGTAGLAVAAVAAVAVVAASAGSDRPGERSPARPALLTVAQISERAAGALATDDIEHVVATLTVDGRTKTTEHWYDPVTHDSCTGSGGSWTVYRDGTVTATYVDRATRTWWTQSRPAPAEKVGPVANATPEELRAALRAGEYRIVSRDAVVHLHAGHPSGGSDDLWVDADSYRIVRRVVVKPGAEARIDLAFDWQPRTPATLARFTVTVPAGFARVDAPGAPVPR
jgi:hypothetical protein